MTSGWLFAAAVTGALLIVAPLQALASARGCDEYQVINGFVPHDTFDSYPAAECTELVQASGPPVVLGIDVAGTPLRFGGVSANAAAGLLGAIYYLDDPSDPEVSIELAREYRTPTGIMYNTRVGTRVEADATLPAPGIRFGPGVAGEWSAAWIAPAGLYIVRVQPSSTLTLDDVIARLIVLAPAPSATGNSFPFSGEAGRWHPVGLISLALLSALSAVSGVLKFRHHRRFREIVQRWRLPRLMSPGKGLVLVVLSGAAVLGAALAVVPAVGVGPADPKANNPFAGMSREERVAAEKAVGADLAAKQANFVANFVKGGADLHSLPAVNINRLVISSGSLEDAVTATTLIVRGSVVAQHLDRKNGRVVSEVRISETVSGQARPQSVLVSQVGGPQLNGDAAMLVQASDDPILWRGREYLLLLGRCDGTAGEGEYCTTGGGRQFEVQAAGTIIPADTEGWAAALRGTSVSQLAERLKAAGSIKP